MAHAMTGEHSPHSSSEVSLVQTYLGLIGVRAHMLIIAIQED
jgi:hypothetical protein